VSELRWILLGAGVALILGLWWWETRKMRPTDGDPADTWPRARAEPTVDAEPEAGNVEPPIPPPFQPTIERIRAPRRPPLVEIPEDVEVDISDYVAKDRRRVPEPEPEPLPASIPEAPHVAQTGAVQADEDVEGGLDEEVDADHRAPWIRTQPLERSEVAPKREPEPEEPQPTDPIEQQTMEASRQRIVALRLVAGHQHWSGKQLREAIEAEGLRYGKYSIFHREREDGKTLFFVASMMEPGSFDLAKMDGQIFSGISLFGIVPGPLAAPATFDMVLATGRRLAERLKGQLQDEQGSTLTAQRILNLREELVHFEHRSKRLRRS
jgi:cell division protein ZipA